MDRVPGYEPGGRGFESCQARQTYFDHMKIQKLNQYFGAKISEVNLSDFSSYIYDDLKKLLIDFGVLVFENQKLNESDHLKFSKLWGKLQVHVLNQYNNRSNPEFFILSNFIDGKPKGEIPDPGAAIWHTDGSWSKNRGLVTILYSLKIPPIGGNTLFCDMKNAINLVNNDLLEKIENLSIIHDLNYSRTLTKAVNQMTEKQKKEAPPVKQNIYRNIPENNTKCIYLGEHASHIESLDVEEGRKIIQTINEMATADDNIYDHVWSEDQIVLWDNRRVMHKATNFDIMRYERTIRRTTTIGDVLP